MMTTTGLIYTLLREDGKSKTTLPSGPRMAHYSSKKKLGIRAKVRKVADSKDLYHLREAQAVYNSNFTVENGVLSAKNTYFWNVNS